MLCELISIQPVCEHILLNSDGAEVLRVRGNKIGIPHLFASPVSVGDTRANKVIEFIDFRVALHGLNNLTEFIEVG